MKHLELAITNVNDGGYIVHDNKFMNGRMIEIHFACTTLAEAITFIRKKFTELNKATVTNGNINLTRT